MADSTALAKTPFRGASDKKKPADDQPAMKEPLKTGKVSVSGLSLLRRFPCSAPAGTTISTTISETRDLAKSSRLRHIF
jgi:hypothetical protein